MPSVAQKSPEAFRTISEVSEELDVPQHVLRFWEGRFAHIRPMKRGGGRRYYRPDDVDLLRGIRTLLYSEGMTIRGVQKVLREQGPRYVMEFGRGETSLIGAAVAEHEPARPRTELRLLRGDEPEAKPRALSKPQRARLEEILDELEGLKRRLTMARRSVA